MTKYGIINNPRIRSLYDKYMYSLCDNVNVLFVFANPMIKARFVDVMKMIRTHRKTNSSFDNVSWSTVTKLLGCTLSLALMTLIFKIPVKGIHFKNILKQMA